jgi:hypothetical protein
VRAGLAGRVEELGVARLLELLHHCGRSPDTGGQPVNPEYGCLWWLNRERRIFPEAPATGVCARGNRSQHVLWIDPARDLVIAAHWSPGTGEFIGEVSRCVPAHEGDERR